MYCKECGKKLTEDAKFCIYCGTKVSKSKKTKILDECPNCKEKRDAKFSFCKNCGYEYKDKQDDSNQNKTFNTIKSNSNSIKIVTLIVMSCIGISTVISILRIIISIILK